VFTAGTVSKGQKEMITTLECLNVVVGWVGKWFKAGTTNAQRRFGFTVSSIVSITWVYYFVKTKQFWLAANSVVAIVITIRGILNNGEEK